MDNLTYIELIAANLLVSQCCVCDAVVGYKEAGYELQIGDHTISHTYCAGCLKEEIEREWKSGVRDADYESK